MLEKRELLEQTIEMYDEIKNLRDNVSKYLKVMDSNEILTAKSASEINVIVVNLYNNLYNTCMNRTAKGEEYFTRIGNAISKNREKFVINEILAELDEALKLFNAEEIERLRNSN